MVIRIELRIFDEIVTPVSFGPKNGNPPPPPKCWDFEDDCVPNGYTGKVAVWWVFIYLLNMTFSDKMQIFLKESS